MIARRALGHLTRALVQAIFNVQFRRARACCSALLARRRGSERLLFWCPSYRDSTFDPRQLGLNAKLVRRGPLSPACTSRGGWGSLPALLAPPPSAPQSFQQRSSVAKPSPTGVHTD